jgi:hypothetical protein
MDGWMEREANTSVLANGASLPVSGSEIFNFTHVNNGWINSVVSPFNLKTKVRGKETGAF